VPRRAVDTRLTNLLSLLTGVALMVASVAEVARDHNSFRWVWTGIGIAGLFIVVVSLIQRRRIGREAK
jgi:bacteriorhodopsin